MKDSERYTTFLLIFLLLLMSGCSPGGQSAPTNTDAGAVQACPNGMVVNTEEPKICLSNNWEDEVLLIARERIQQTELENATFVFWELQELGIFAADITIDGISILGIEVEASSGRKMYLRIDSTNPMLKDAFRNALAAGKEVEDVHPIIVETHEYFLEQLDLDQLKITGGVAAGNGQLFASWWDQKPGLLRILVENKLGADYPGNIPLPDEPVTKWRRNSDAR